ncbi:MAG: hypothetical protein QW652_02715, partial [Candidatus Nitrosotenuis sp.]
NKSLSELTEHEIKLIQKEFDAKKLHKIISEIDADYSLTARSSAGSAGIAQQKKMIAVRKKKILKYRKNMKRRTILISSTITALSRKIQNLIK